MAAKLIYKNRIVYDSGHIQEMVIWGLPEPVVGSSHHYKYSLFYGKPGERIIGYDNERPKGDHRHYRKDEENYTFTTVKQLVDDFMSDIEEERSLDDGNQ
jgi:hypothetical protein